MTEYLVIYEQSEDGGWGAYFPDLPGVIALGGTREEVEERVQEALAAYADLMREEGRELPVPVHGAGTAHI